MKIENSARFLLLVFNIFQICENEKLAERSAIKGKIITKNKGREAPLKLC